MTTTKPTEIHPGIDRAMIRAEDLVKAHRAGNATAIEAQIGKDVRRCLTEAIQHPGRTETKVSDAIGYIEHVPVSHFSEELGELRRVLAQILDDPGLEHYMEEA